MAGASVGPSTQGRRKSLDAEIILVPFIDLLSMCICFLLMTAVWVEVGAIQVKQLLGTEAAATTTQSIDIEVRFKATQDLDLVIQKGGKVIQSVPIEGTDLKQRLSRLSTVVGNVVNALNMNQQNSQAPPPSITAKVLPVKQVNYGDMVAVLDIMRGYGISNLGVIPAKE